MTSPVIAFGRHGSAYSPMVVSLSPNYRAFAQNPDSLYPSAPQGQRTKRRVSTDRR